jgi:hypothetical protein
MFMTILLFARYNLSPVMLTAISYNNFTYTFTLTPTAWVLLGISGICWLVLLVAYIAWNSERKEKGKKGNSHRKAAPNVKIHPSGNRQEVKPGAAKLNVKTQAKPAAKATAKPSATRLPAKSANGSVKANSETGSPVKPAKPAKRAPKLDPVTGEPVVKPVKPRAKKAAKIVQMVPEE